MNGTSERVAIHEAVGYVVERHRGQGSREVARVELKGVGRQLGERGRELTPESRVMMQPKGLEVAQIPEASRHGAL